MWLAGDVGTSVAGHPGSIQRLVWVRGHLHRVQHQGLTLAEREEITRLLLLIQQDVASLLQALGN